MTCLFLVFINHMFSNIYPLDPRAYKLWSYFLIQLISLILIIFLYIFKKKNKKKMKKLEKVPELVKCFVIKQSWFNFRNEDDLSIKKN